MASKSPRRRRPAAPKAERGPIARALITVGKIGVGAGLLLALLLAVAVAISMASLPGYRELMRSPNGQMVQVRSADGGVLVSVGPSYGEWLAFDEIPQTMIDAMIAVEDRRFYSHPGVDPIGTARALAVNLKAGGSVQGGSTITQQLARNVFLTSTQTYGRKVREAILALALEQRFTKREILELYLNRVYFGGGAYGIDAASRKFYGHGAERLSLEEAAIIAGLVKAPSRYAPSSDPRKAKRRAKTVIAVMADAGKITTAQAAAADVDSLRFAPQPKQNNVRYFTDWVLAELETLTDETVEPLVVTTTLMSGMQQAADRSISANTPGKAQGALVAMSTDGAVRAMVGGKDYVSSIYNRAVSARRPGGSAFKLFVYLAALEDGVEPDDIVVDEPVSFGNWSPRNNDRTYRGEVTVRQAFALSINTVAVQLAARVGFDTVADMARRFGVTTRIDRRPAMALGASDVNLLEMTSAYASVARGGVEATPYAITKVTTSRGRTLYTREAEEPRMLVAPWVAAKMTDLLKAVVDSGTGRRAAIGREVAGKTGTTSSNRDGWFFGFTGDIVAGVWMGRDDNKVVAGLAGGRAPTAAWADFMRIATRGMPSQSLQTEVALPEDGFLEPDAEVYGIYPPGEEPPASDGGVPAGDPAVATAPRQPRMDDDFLDEVLAEPPTSTSADPV
jgi:penicillin-binding protein 1A